MGLDGGRRDVIWDGIGWWKAGLAAGWDWMVEGGMRCGMGLDGGRRGGMERGLDEVVVGEAGVGRSGGGVCGGV